MEPWNWCFQLCRPFPINFLWPSVDIYFNILYFFLSHISDTSSSHWKHSTNPLQSGYYHVHGEVPRWLKKVESNIDRQTSQQVSAAVRAEKKSSAAAANIGDGQNNYFDKGIRLDKGMHSLNQNSSIPMCQDGITRRTLTFVTGCSDTKADLEVRSSCGQRDINFPKCRYSNS